MTIQLKKSHFYLLLGLGVPFMLAVIFFLFKGAILPKNNSAANGETTVNVATTPAVADIKFTNYEDPLGFSLSYPGKFTINKHPDDQTNYANIELSGAAGENFKIIASDPPQGDLSAYIKQDNELSDGSVLDSTISDLAVKKIYISKTNKTVLLGLWDGMLLKIEYTPSDGKEFSQTAGKILESMKIPEKANSTDGSVSTDTSTGASVDTSGGDDSSIEEIE